MAKIAVEQGPDLQDVREALQQNGHEIVSADAGNLQNCECCVISGLDENMMGVADTATKASVINARGMTADEIVRQVNQRLR